ncbi:hypothetical protein GJAV_G00185400 [Gymnothorax javanicus]|nr:hypothetical protein GJAV_G00185400 [Gymnothorax javanicus]
MRSFKILQQHTALVMSSITACAQGYIRASGSPYVRCVKGLWTQLQLTCTRRPCGSAGEIFSGHFDYMGTEALFGDVIVAVCQEGYRLKGSRYRLCEASGWIGEIPSCEEGTEITCPSPSVAHGVKIKGDAAVYIRGINVTFTCVDGFTLRGPREITCGADGQWHPRTPECLFSNAEVLVNSGKPVNSSAVTRTDEDLSRRGAPSEGTEITCPSPSVAHGVKIKGDAAVYIRGINVTFTCVDGFTLRGPREITCGADGQWHPRTPECLFSNAEVLVNSGKPVNSSAVTRTDEDLSRRGAPSEVFLLVAFFLHLSASEDCGEPQDYPNTLLRNAKAAYSPRDVLYYRCAQGYTRVSGSPYVRCVKGLWTQLQLTCTRSSCGSAGEILNGHFDYMGKEALFGDVIVAVCQEGYRLKGSRYRLCETFGWSGEIPSCEEGTEITCPSPSVAHGVKIKGDAAVYIRGINVTFTCVDGFTLRGPREITCGADGQWHPRTPECLFSNAEVLVNSGKPVNSSAVTRADEDLSRRGAPSDGCSAPPYFKSLILADQFLSQRDFPPGSQVRYTCALGYRRSRGRTGISRCEGKRWTPFNLKCERKSCGSAGEIMNGYYKYSGVLFGDTVSAVCNVGYTMIGRNYRLCQDQGWDGKAPVCEAVQCDDPPEVPNGARIGEQEGPFMYGTVIGYRCRQGRLIGPDEIYCTANGTWNAPPPECIDATCPYPSVRFGRRIGVGRSPYKYGEYVTFQCNEGYRLNGPSKVTCGHSGQWTPRIPECRAITCPLPNIPFAQLKGLPTQFKPGKPMYVSCIPGYELRGRKKITCGNTGQWLSELPQCYNRKAYPSP